MESAGFSRDLVVSHSGLIVLVLKLLVLITRFSGKWFILIVYLSRDIIIGSKR